MTARSRRAAILAAILSMVGAVGVVGCSGGAGGRGRLRRRRSPRHVQHQHRGGCRVGWPAGVRSRAHRIQLSRTRRAGRRRPRLRHHLGGRSCPADPRLPDQRQRGVLRRQADHVRRHGAGLGRPVGSVSRLRRREPGRLRRRRGGRLCAWAEEGPRDVRAGPRIRGPRPVVRRDVDDARARNRRRTRRRRWRGHHRAVGGRRADDRSHRRGLEHHLEPQRRPRPEALPVVGAVQARLGHQGRCRRARRQRQVVGRETRHPPRHRVAARRRRPGPRQHRLHTTSSTWRRDRRAP